MNDVLTIYQANQYNAVTIKKSYECINTLEGIRNIRMQSRQVLTGKTYNFIRSLTRRNFRECAILMAGVCVVSGIVLGAAGFAGNDRNQVYAVQPTGENREEHGEIGNELQAGLMGIVNSMNTMEEYSVAVSSVDIENAGEEILIGTKRVKKKELNRKTVASGVAKASGLGYYAIQTVENNHMASEDYYSLLQVVEAEATGGDMKSKILVADVVLNRVRDERFPDKIYDVIWQQSGGAPQFSPTADGRIHSVTVTEETIEAVDRALAGEDYSQGALFFVARSSADENNVEWFDGNLKPLFSYGGHEYFTFDE